MEGVQRGERLEHTGRAERVTDLRLERVDEAARGITKGDCEGARFGKIVEGRCSRVGADEIDFVGRRPRVRYRE